METVELIKQLKRIAVMDKLRCMGCGYEHNCSIHGCQIIKEAADRLETVEEQLSDNKLLTVPDTGIGDLSDGYHTFNELYHHRAILFSVICNANPQLAWKARHHYDGTMYDGMFIVGIDTPEGQATYHYDTDPYWDIFRVRELKFAPAWDGHTPEEAIERIGNLSIGWGYTKHGRWLRRSRYVAECSVCHKLGDFKWIGCPHCLADMRNGRQQAGEEE